MKAKRTGAAVSLLAAGALLLSACGSDNNTTASSGSGDVRIRIGRGLRRQGSSEGQRFVRPGQRDDAVRHRLRERLPRLHPELHLERFGRRCLRVPRQPDRLRRLGLPAERREGRGRQGQGALRRQRGLEPARGVRADRHHLQRRRRRRPRARRPHRWARSSTAPSRPGTHPAIKALNDGATPPGRSRST